MVNILNIEIMSVSFCLQGLKSLLLTQILISDTVGEHDPSVNMYPLMAR